MGNVPSDLAPLNEFCYAQHKASEDCIKAYDYDRERYWRPCSQQFRDYRACKATWQSIRKGILKVDENGDVYDPKLKEKAEKAAASNSQQKQQQQQQQPTAA